MRRNIILSLLGFIMILSGGLSLFLLTTPRKEAQAVVRSAEEESFKSKQKHVEVLVPIVTIPSGSPLRVTHFQQKKMPEHLVPSGSISDFSEIRSRYAKSLIVRGHPLHRDFIESSPSRRNHILPKIPEGYRAVPIPVNKTDRVGIWAIPGAFVDVFVYTGRGTNGRLTPVVQAAQILSVDRITDEKADSKLPIPTSITLLASEEDSRRIRVAEQIGNISLTLRGEKSQLKSASPKPMTAEVVLGKRAENESEHENITGQLILSDGSVWGITPNGDFIPLDKPAKRRKGLRDYRS